MNQSLLTEFQPIAAIAITSTAAQTLQPVCQATGAVLWVPESLKDLKNVQFYSGSLKSHIASIWNNHRAFIFSLATGAVVRLIATLLADKYRDPAVIVIDENGNFVISLCGGHQGKADELTRAIAVEMGATPVLTGASASLGLAGVDILGVPFGWVRGNGDWIGVSAAVARGEAVEVIQEVGSILWRNSLPKQHSFKFAVTGKFDSGDLAADGLSVGGKFDSGIAARIWITIEEGQSLPESDVPMVKWHPRVLWVGIGCERGTSKRLIEMAIRQTCQRYRLSEFAIAGIATIDIKADEIGIIELCRDANFPLQTFSSEILSLIKVPTPSDIVAAEVGTASVAEAAAICASLSSSSPTPHSAIPTPLVAPKQIFKSEDEAGAVTVAIAQSHLEYIGRKGKLLLVGIGPGKLDQITPAAKMAVSRADAVIGYSLYIDLIAPIFRPGQIIESLPITQERQRAIRAIELAEWGLNVAVVSSGDCGIYGMAGLVLEELKLRQWDGKIPEVQVFPGITALQGAASRVGAPLMHDFCAISLSDLLTPWEVIEKRLEAAAQADFVTAFYNPRSRNRTAQIAIAQQIFLKYRYPHTPVAIVRCAYREDEEITLTTLDKLLDIPIDMLTTILIGNQTTTIHGDWMITPRGYLGLGTRG
ncbi:MAG TPA: precorrin-3B C(17)-methyltransferase [Cyanobacteria bacterium UBA11149]|nr:precorrin-3B C(17)-methyltransferase [Cyanobacteria bacterium UBA11367]HBE60374.1 precorrin-3B C(17)-methyltransferase [Cyanobacteria bacterium UBA11366]HBK62664.1 precorrin-3B C(17)-methyltransferase [Cyanobacteria bacterium UBA11166]HBR73236.1 precorrin-3B C(17)-methyltransferase [Cyanobacteria bacterium UBA11159]HBW91919.1 precorrin-3B C(17)-methyltransferase [Cyanobacteria bacterium UBA11149]HCA96705.1 precorrin-3B C(17)-methyltransferase [Cyanobacteria bacterium UBA9226]